jgi:uncharacterized protein (TIGR02246 family)
MRLGWITGMLGALALLAAADRTWAQSNVGGIRTDETNEKLVRKLYDDFSDAWNRHDVPAMTSHWAIDGDHLEPDGTRAKGRDVVQKLFQRQHDTVFKASNLDINVEDVWFHGENIAVVDGGYELTGARLPDGSELPARRGHLTSVLLQEDGRWWIAANRLMIPAQLPYKK